MYLMSLCARVLGVCAWVSKLSRQLIVTVLRCGPVPQHTAFIMDGNRRFATKQGLQRIHGHQQGYLKLLDALQWSLDLGVKAITVYAFSIDNFRRGTDEVEALMTLAEQKLLELMENQELIQTHKVRVQVLGDLSLLPDRVQQAARQAMEATRRHTGCFLNICMAYTSQQEISQAVLKANQMLAGGSIGTDEITAHFLEQQLYTQGCPPVDLLIRTSGEHRLSDFLLWQSQFALLVFSDTLWPDYSFWDLLQALVQYQRSYPHLQELAALRQTCIHASDERCERAAAPQSQDAKFGSAADDKMCEADVQGSAEELPVVKSDTDTSDSSVSSDSRPTSRSSSPMHSAQSQQHQLLLQLHQQPSQEAAVHDADADSQHLSNQSDRFQRPVAFPNDANDAVQMHLPSRLDSLLSQTDGNLMHSTCLQLEQADDTQQQCHAPDLIHCAPVGTDIQLLAETNCWNSVCFSKAKLM